MLWPLALALLLLVVLCARVRLVSCGRAPRRGLQRSLPVDIVMASPPRGLKMAILLWSDEPIYDYALPTWRLNCMYGRRYGFDVIRSSRRRWDRHAMWQRVPLLRQYLPEYDYVMWLDADAAFDPRAPDVAELIAARDFPDVIVTEDFPDGERFGAYQGELSEADALATNINSGVVVVKSSAGGRALLDMWSREEFSTVHDQCALRRLYHRSLQSSVDFGRVVRMPRDDLQMLLAQGKALAATSPGFLLPLGQGYIWHLAGSDFHTRTGFFRDMQSTASCYYEEPLFWLRAQSRDFDRDLYAAFESSWRLVDRPEDATLHVVFGAVESAFWSGGDVAVCAGRELVQSASPYAQKAEAALAAFSRSRCLSARPHNLYL